MKGCKLKVGGRIFDGGTHIMGIVNVTPDSFFAPSRADSSALVDTVGRLINDGAEIIDIGGQSTRPGAMQISEEEELSRVLPAVNAVRAAYSDALISVDTFFPSVARACAECGADMINDVSGLRYEGMAEVIARAGISVTVMRDSRAAVGPIMADKMAGLDEALRALLAAGVDRDRIMLDAGIGFNRSREEDLEVLEGYPKLMAAFDRPFLLGTSRKSMFGGRVEDRLPQTLETTLFAKRIGALFVRVHDVKENAAVLSANCLE